MDLWLDDTVTGMGNNPVAAALVTWLLEKVYLWIRATLGSMNINSKTLGELLFFFFDFVLVFLVSVLFFVLVFGFFLDSFWK